MNSLPLITILTPSLNRAGMIAEAIESVLAQDYPHIEHLILDGGSTDGTLEVLRGYPHLRLVSEPDEGLYDAINKGLALAQGEIIGLLNTDDFYEAGVFGQVAELMASHPEVQAAAGAVSIFRTNAQGQRETLLTYPSQPGIPLLERVTVGVPGINAFFFRRKVFDSLGDFDLGYRYAADRDFLVRLAYREAPYLQFDRVVYHYRQHPDSLTITGDPHTSAPFVAENLHIARRLLADPDLPQAMRTEIVRWHSEMTAGQVYYYARRLQARQAYAYLASGWRADPDWPRLFAQRAAKKFPR